MLGRRVHFKLIISTIINICLLVTLIFSYNNLTKPPNNDTSDEEQSITVKDRLYGNNEKYSSFYCTGSMNRPEKLDQRVCLFRNICYDKHIKEFNYYKPITSNKHPILFHPRDGLIYNFFYKQFKFVRIGTAYREALKEQNYFSPIIINGSLPISDKNTIYLSTLHVLWKWFNLPNFNLGHTLWEDIASTYISMMRLNVYSRKAVLLSLYPLPNNKSSEYSRIFSQVLPSFINKYLSLNDYKNRYVCFKQLLAGGNVKIFDYEESIQGRESLFYNFRTMILKYHGIDLKHPPTKHRILLVNKTHSGWDKRVRTRRTIFNLAEVKLYLEKTYPNIPVDVIVPQQLPFSQQLKELYKTTILITPCGGISAFIPFLPRRAYAIIMDYYASYNFINHKKGDSASMEGVVWNHFPHITKLYYQIYNSSDWVWDLPKTNNTRIHASIVIKMPRLKKLIETALENSIFATM